MEAKHFYSKSLTRRLTIQAPTPFEAGKQAGIREVVEWIRNHYAGGRWKFPTKE
ncbi:hypothetical protein LCGC14_2184110 [marine sediment metagenome]|uniref:Uncharacterized protein n=1 Tax=marine sediment metagenome TaxID=412755 RepID=A0A0F9FYU4_9ZZZZ